MVELKWGEAEAWNRWVTQRMIRARQWANFTQEQVIELTGLKRLQDYESEAKVWRLDHLYVLTELYEISRVYIFTGAFA